VNEKIKVNIEIPKLPESAGRDSVVVFQRVRPDQAYYDGDGWAFWEGPGPSRRKYLVIQEKKYREPVLPADAGKACEFSYNGENWGCGQLFGFRFAKSGATKGCWLDEKLEEFNWCRIEVKNA
jgi:hypothetical protein